MKIKKVDDKPMVIHTKEKAKIHSHEPKGARIKGSNIYTVERGPKIAGAKAAETMGKKSYRKSTVYQVNVKEKGLSRFKRNVREAKHIYEVTETEVVNPYDNSIKTQSTEKELTLLRKQNGYRSRKNTYQRGGHKRISRIIKEECHERAGK